MMLAKFCIRALSLSGSSQSGKDMVTVTRELLTRTLEYLVSSIAVERLVAVLL